LFGVDKWKTGEILGNLWRYDLAQRVATHLSPYEEVAVNKDSALDTDVLRYKFLHDVTISSPNLRLQSKYHDYIYSCNTLCDINQAELSYLLQKFNSEKIKSSQGEAYLFHLDKPVQRGNVAPINNSPKLITRRGYVKKESMFHTLYLHIFNILQVPFL